MPASAVFVVSWFFAYFLLHLFSYTNSLTLSVMVIATLAVVHTLNEVRFMHIMVLWYSNGIGRINVLITSKWSLIISMEPKKIIKIIKIVNNAHIIEEVVLEEELITEKGELLR